MIIILLISEKIGYSCSRHEAVIKIDAMPPFAAPKKPTVNEVHNVLRRYDGLIVHFSGAPKGAGIDRGHLYPEDLRHVEQGKAIGGVSCSIVRPTDVFHGNSRNATGCIGLVLDLIEPDSLVAVSPNDCGSIEIDGVRTVDREIDISATDIEKSIEDRQADSYNEWVLRNFKVLGVFAVFPFEISMQCKLPLPEGAPDYLSTTDNVIGVGKTNLAEVMLQFSCLSVYTFQQGRLIGVPRHSDLYRS